MRGAKVLGVDSVLVEKEQKDGSILLDDELVHTLAVGKGYRIFATEHVGRTVQALANVERLRRDRHLVVEFEEDAIITVEGLHENLKTVRSIQFARPLETNLRDLNYMYSNADGDPLEMFHNRVSKWPGWRALLASLLHQGVKPLYVEGGLKFARAFSRRETIIPAPPRDDNAYSDVGDIRHFYIVPVAEIDSNIATLPDRD